MTFSAAGTSSGSIFGCNVGTRVPLEDWGRSDLRPHSRNRFVHLLASGRLMAATGAHTGADAAAACRLAHATDPAAHVACLEEAVRHGDAVPSPAEPKTNAPAGLGSEHLRDKRPAEYHE